MEEEDIIKVSDKAGLHPVWPDIDATLNLAANTYTRLTTSNEWNLPKASQVLYTVTCWNCGKDHTLRDCPAPRDEDKITKARKAFQANRSKKGKGPRRDDKGRPLKFNKKHVLVVDTKRYREEQAKADKKSSDKQDKNEKDSKDKSDKSDKSSSSSSSDSQNKGTQDKDTAVALVNKLADPNLAADARSEQARLLTACIDAAFRE